MSHTPGPWVAVDDEIISERTEANIADVRLCDDTNPNEWQANLRLIAAAPDLLAALKVFAGDGVFEDFPDDFRAQVLAAIAKAEGLTHGT